MAKQTHYTKRDQPKKRPRRHTKNLNKKSTFKKYNKQGR
tara:strand:- start:431 stop:547 length:117 start_codon:yes stop_codon:yes gene_type:complete